MRSLVKQKAPRIDPARKAAVKAAVVQRMRVKVAVRARASPAAAAVAAARRRSLALQAAVQKVINQDDNVLAPCRAIIPGQSLLHRAGLVLPRLCVSLVLTASA